MKLDFKRFFFISSFFLFQSCASLASKKQIISIDSKPRGVKVYNDQSGKVIGNTPFFYEVSRSKSFNVSLDYAASRKRFKTSCDFRWWTAGFANSLVGLINLPVSVLYFGIDFLTENAWHCDDVNIHLDSEPYSKNKCLKLFVVPPYSSSEINSFKILRKWTESYKTKSNSCFEFVSHEDHIKYYDYLNLGLHKKFLFTHLKEHKKRKIGLMTDADTLVILDVIKNEESENTKKTKIKSSFFDLHRSNEITSLSNEIIIENEIKSSTASKSALDITFEFLPNSLSYGFYSKSSLEGSEKHLNESKSDIWDKIFSFSIGSTKSPLAYDDWDISLGLYPDIDFFSYQVNDFNERGEINNLLKLYNISASYAGHISLYTPLGQFTLSAGLGPSLGLEVDQNNHKNLNISGFVHQNFSYNAFITKNMYFFTDTKNSNLSNRIRVGTINYNFIHTYTVGLGYYFTNMVSGGLQLFEGLY